MAQPSQQPSAGQAELAHLLAGTEALDHLDAAYEAAWRATDADLLDLCRRRVATLLGAPLEDDGRPASDDLERAALAFTEHYVVDVAPVPDELVAPLRAELGDVGLVDFVNALLVVEQRLTLELALGALR